MTSDVTYPSAAVPGMEFGLKLVALRAIAICSLAGLTNKVRGALTTLSMCHMQCHRVIMSDGSLGASVLSHALMAGSLWPLLLSKLT